MPADLAGMLVLCDVCCCNMLCPHDCHRTLVENLCRRFRISHDMADTDHPHHEPGTILHAQEWLATHQALHLSIQELIGGDLARCGMGCRMEARVLTNNHNVRAHLSTWYVYQLLATRPLPH